MVVFPQVFGTCNVAGDYCRTQSLYFTDGDQFQLTIPGLLPLEVYKVMVCAMSCTPPAGDFLLFPPIQQTTSPAFVGPTFFSSDPFSNSAQPGDSDGDGFSDAVENYIGTNVNVKCTTNGWPPDFTNDGKVTFADLLQLAGKYNTVAGQANYSLRFDISANGSIGFADLLLFSQNYNKNC